MPETDRPLRVFLCHSSNDKPAVRELYQRLHAEGWMDIWLDVEKLYPGQDWDLEIEKAVEATDVVIVCLSSNSVSKEGYVQRELRFVLRIADFKPEGAIFVVPVRLDDCPMPRRLAMWQYTDLFPDDRKDWAYKRLLGSLKMRAKNVRISVDNLTTEKKHMQTDRRAYEQIDKENSDLTRIEKLRKTMHDQQGILRTSDLVEFGIPRTYLSIMEKSGEIKRVSRGIYHSTAISIEDVFFTYQSQHKSSIYSHETAFGVLNNSSIWVSFQSTK